MKINKIKTKKAIIMVFQLAGLLAYSSFISGCKEICPSVYFLEFPKAPKAWVSLLGEPHWRVEWYNPESVKQTADVMPGKSLVIEIPAEWANPVTAWPYWPLHNLTPGLFKPAGAIFPFDTEDGGISLSWEAGPDAFFYWELVSANKQNYSRLPANFDWPRFRELFKTDKLKEAVREDPWLINWRNAAEKTASGNFDTRRLVPEASVFKNIPVSSALPDYLPGTQSIFWHGTSPFMPPLYFKEDEPSVFPVRPGINIWISAAGILRVNGNVWVFTETGN